MITLCDSLGRPLERRLGYLSVLETNRDWRPLELTDAARPTVAPPKPKPDDGDKEPDDV